MFDCAADPNSSHDKVVTYRVGHPYITHVYKLLGLQIKKRFPKY